jgi:PAS domain S-box-containing protein
VVYGQWTAGLGWLHILSDLGVWSAYVAIPCVLGYFVLRRKDVPFRTIFWLFGAFILACGTTHLMEALIFWWPAYRLAGVIKLLTALVSWGTVLALVPVTPKALAMRSPEDLEKEIAARKNAENALQQANAELERRVEERTAELLRVNGSLQHERERFRTTLSSIGDAVMVTDTRGKVTFLNAVAQSLTAWNMDEALGQPLERVFQIINEQTRQPAENPAARALKEGKIVGLANQTVLIAKDGTEVMIDDSAGPISDETGHVTGVVLVFRDVTQRRQAEETLREQADLLDLAHDAIIVRTTEGVITFWNTGAGELYGWAKDEALGKVTHRLFQTAFSKPLSEIEAELEQRGRWEGVLTHTCKDATQIVVASRWALRRAGPGKRPFVLEINRDITERKRAEEGARKSQEIFKLVHSIGKIGHWEWNSVTDENRWSPEIEALYGLKPGTFEGSYEAWARLLHPDDLAKAEEDVRKAMETGKYFTEFRVIWPDGNVHWLETRANVFTDCHGKPIRIMGVNMDITQRNQIEESLRESDRRKDEFLATLAHELRNPLAPLRSGLQVLRLANERSDREAAREMMERQLGQLVRLVDDLLDISRISRNRLELRKARVPLASVIENAVETARSLIDARGHTLTVTLPSETFFVDADLTRLAQVFWNLLNNAAKYTNPGGRIELSAACEVEELIVTVRDTGIGIPAAAMPKLFTIFSQVDHSLEQSQGGLGIGLALVKGLVEMHGGTVAAHSAGVGQGSQFVVRLPLAQGEPQEQDQPPRAVSPPPPQKRILVVDDNRDAAASLSMMLALLGHDTRTAHDGLEALDVAAAFRPEIVLLDIGMPKLNGYDVARRIRQEPWGKDMVLLACTGWGQEQDRLRSEEAGFNAHLVKPVNLAVLEKILATCTSQEGEGVRPSLKKPPCGTDQTNREKKPVFPKAEEMPG